MMNNRPLLLRRDAFREAEEVVLVNMRWIREAQEWADRMEAGMGRIDGEPVSNAYELPDAGATPAMSTR